MKSTATHKHKLSPVEARELMATLEQRFERHAKRHPGISWGEVEESLKHHPDKLWCIAQMELTGGEPDVTGREKTGAIIFTDCAVESPKGRRSWCYDEKARAARKENKPLESADGAATAMGVELLDEEQYRALQELGEFDTKTSSWIKTPAAIRNLGGALFCDRRYNCVFVYHNGADSYYAARGFRSRLVV